MRKRLRTNPAYWETDDGLWVGTNDLGMFVTASSREEAKQRLAEATLQAMTSMGTDALYRVLGEPEEFEADPETDCLTQRLLSESAPPIPGASPEVMDRIRRTILGPRPERRSEPD